MSWHHTQEFSDLLPIGCLFVVRPTTVVSSANLMMVLELFGHAVVGEEGVQEGTNYTHLRGPSVEDQLGRRVVASPYHLGVARQEVQDPVAEGGPILFVSQ